MCECMSNVDSSLFAARFRARRVVRTTERNPVEIKQIVVISNDKMLQLSCSIWLFIFHFTALAGRCAFPVCVFHPLSSPDSDAVRCFSLLFTFSCLLRSASVRGHLAPVGESNRAQTMMMTTNRPGPNEPSPFDELKHTRRLFFRLFVSFPLASGRDCAPKRTRANGRQLPTLGDALQAFCHSFLVFIFSLLDRHFRALFRWSALSIRQRHRASTGKALTDHRSSKFYFRITFSPSLRWPLFSFLFRANYAIHHFLLLKYLYYNDT